MTTAILKVFQRKPDGMILIDADPLSDDDSEQRLITEEQFEKLKKLMSGTLWIESLSSIDGNQNDLKGKPQLGCES